MRMRFVALMVLAAVLGCEEGNPAQRDDEGGGGQGGAGGASGDGGAGGTGGEAEPDAAPDAGPYDDPRWGDDGLWHGWPEDPNDATEYGRCSARCGGCKEIRIYKEGVQVERSDRETPWRLPRNTDIEYEYQMSIGQCGPGTVLPTVDLTPRDGTRRQGPTLFYVADHVVEVTPTDAMGRGKLVIRTGETPIFWNIRMNWPQGGNGQALLNVEVVP